MLRKRGYFLFFLHGDITGDLQVNDTDLYHPLKTSYREKEALLMTNKLRKYPDKIPSSKRDEIRKMCMATFAEILAKIDISDAFKGNGLIKLGGSEDHQVSNKLKAFRSQLLSKPHPNTLKKFEEVMIPPDGAKRKLLDEVIDGMPPDEGCEVLDGEYTHDEWDDNENENANESEDEDSTSNTVPQNDVLSVACTPENESTPERESTPVDPELKADLEYLGRIE